MTSEQIAEIRDKAEKAIVLMTGVPSENHTYAELIGGACPSDGLSLAEEYMQDIVEMCGAKA